MPKTPLNRSGYVAVATAVTRAREAAGMSMAVLGRRLGVSVTYVCDIEHAHKIPTLAMAYEMEGVLGCRGLVRAVACVRGSFEMRVTRDPDRDDVAEELCERWDGLSLLTVHRIRHMLTLEDGIEAGFTE